MIALRYTVELLEPVLATALQSDPNSAVSYPFIPGSLVRGAIVGKYLASRTVKDFAIDPDARRRFLDGSICYLNAYLLGRENHRTLPTPLSWYKDKKAKPEDGYPIVDKAHPDFSEETFDLDGYKKIEQPKPQAAQFFTADKSMVRLYKPARQINIHTRREDRNAGRATDDELGAVFRYDALAAGQSFIGIVLCDTDADADDMFSMLNDTELIMGGSRSGGYGRVHLGNVEKLVNWHETGNAPTGISAGEVFSLTLLSDMILRDDNGQFTDMLSEKTVARALHITPDNLIARKTYRQTAIVGGFNRKWGLPLPQNLAIRAGSVFTFKTTVDIPAGDVEQLHWCGLGERRTEGFGRIAVNLLNIEVLNVSPKTHGQTTQLDKPKLDAVSKELAQQMNERLFRRNADQRLLTFVNQSRILNPPKRSQLGGMRNNIREAIQDADVTTVKEYLTEMKIVARKQFENARVWGESSNLHEWLKIQLGKPDEILSKLGKPDPLGIEGISVTVTPKMKAEYTLRFIDAVLAKASKESQND